MEAWATRPVMRNLAPAIATRKIATTAIDGMPLQPIPSDAKPQLVIIATGVHKNGVLNGLTSLIVERGASVMGAKRNSVAGAFSAMISVYIPPRRSIGTGISPDAFKSYLESSAGIDPRLKGFNVSVVPLADGTAVAAPSAPAHHRKLRVEAPQMPGLLNSLTRVMLEDNCAVDALSADVITAGGAPVFFATGDIGVPSQVDPGSVFEKLAAWAVDNKAKVNFEEAAAA